MILLLALGLGMFVLTLCVQLVPTVILIRIVTSRHPSSLLRPSFGANVILLQLVAALVLLAHLVSIALWALLLCLCGEFAEFETAYYHSAVNYSSLGYGDIVMSARWRLLGPLETIDGIVMFGISTALIFALMMHLIERRLKAKEPEMADSNQLSGDRK
jgi:Ion channel